MTTQSESEKPFTMRENRSGQVTSVCFSYASDEFIFDSVLKFLCCNGLQN